MKLFARTSLRTRLTLASVVPLGLMLLAFALVLSTVWRGQKAGTSDSQLADRRDLLSVVREPTLNVSSAHTTMVSLYTSGQVPQNDPAASAEVAAELRSKLDDQRDCLARPRV